MIRKKKAFTLAEVLITLTIIGVIAAITIPNLMQSWRKHQIEVGIKEAYSIVQNIIKMSSIDNGPLRDWPNTHGQGYDYFTWAQRFVTPYVKTQYLCRNRTISRYVLNTKCFKYDGLSGTYYNFDGTVTDRIKYGFTMKLKNGMDMNVSGWNDGFLFDVDVNGNGVGPSRRGYDIFSFYADRASGKVTTYNSASDCTATSVWGNGCTTIIMQNGWKIPDNYPVKKF